MMALCANDVPVTALCDGTSFAQKVIVGELSIVLVEHAKSHLADELFLDIIR